MTKELSSTGQNADVSASNSSIVVEGSETNGDSNYLDDSISNYSSFPKEVETHGFQQDELNLIHESLLKNVSSHVSLKKFDENKQRISDQLSLMPDSPISASNTTLSNVVFTHNELDKHKSTENKSTLTTNPGSNRQKHTISNNIPLQQQQPSHVVSMNSITPSTANNSASVLSQSLPSLIPSMSADLLKNAEFSATVDSPARNPNALNKDSLAIKSKNLPNNIRAAQKAQEDMIAQYKAEALSSADPSFLSSIAAPSTDLLSPPEDIVTLSGVETITPSQKPLMKKHLSVDHIHNLRNALPQSQISSSFQPNDISTPNFSMSNFRRSQPVFQRPVTSVRPAKTHSRRMTHDNQLESKYLTYMSAPPQSEETIDETSETTPATTVASLPQLEKTPSIVGSHETDEQVETSILLRPENLTLCIAKYPYDAEKKDELTFQEGQVIRVIRKEIGGWWEGQLDLQIGWFPANLTDPYTVEELPEDEAYKYEYSMFANTEEEIDTLRANTIVKYSRLKGDDISSFGGEFLTEPEESIESEAKDNRVRIIKDIIKSETSFLETMNKFTEEFITPLETVQWMSSADHEIIFEDVKLIAKMHADILELFKQHWKGDPKFPIIQHVFEDMEVRFRNTYLGYCINLPKVVETATTYSSKPEMNVFLYGTSAKATNPMILHLVSILHKPIQHKQKFGALLKDLLSNTHMDHPDYHATSSANEMYLSMNEEIEVLKKKTENNEKILKLMRKIQGWGEGPGMLCFGDLIDDSNLILTEGGKKSECTFYLLEKLLVIVRLERKKTDAIYHVVFKIPMNRSNLKGLSDFDESGLDFLIHYQSEDGKSRNLLVTAYNLEQKTRWMVNIERHLEKNTRPAFPSLPREIQEEIRASVDMGNRSSLQITNTNGASPSKFGLTKTKKWFNGLGSILKRRPSIIPSTKESNSTKKDSLSRERSHANNVEETTSPVHSENLLTRVIKRRERIGSDPASHQIRTSRDGATDSPQHFDTISSTRSTNSPVLASGLPSIGNSANPSIKSGRTSKLGSAVSLTQLHQREIEDRDVMTKKSSIYEDSNSHSHKTSEVHTLSKLSITSGASSTTSGTMPDSEDSDYVLLRPRFTQGGVGSMPRLSHESRSTADILKTIKSYESKDSDDDVPLFKLASSRDSTDRSSSRTPTAQLSRSDTINANRRETGSNIGSMDHQRNSSYDVLSESTSPRTDRHNSGYSLVEDVFEQYENSTLTRNRHEKETEVRVTSPTFSEATLPSSTSAKQAPGISRTASFSFQKKKQDSVRRSQSQLRLSTTYQNLLSDLKRTISETSKQTRKTSQTPEPGSYSTSSASNPTNSVRRVRSDLFIGKQSWFQSTFKVGNSGATEEFEGGEQFDEDVGRRRLTPRLSLRSKQGRKGRKNSNHKTPLQNSTTSPTSPGLEPVVSEEYDPESVEYAILLEKYKHLEAEVRELRIRMDMMEKRVNTPTPPNDKGADS
ncbi:hypothetical protein HK098_006186 [Nowakowskiella sp. JEL0407]|nr:hypothetical protein HK098_006186 [Nowakowskiella sp. JEL0407]